MSSTPSGSKRFSFTQWLIVSLAAIGFLFDIYELLMAPYVVRPAILELTGYKPGTPEFGNWAATIFYLPAVVGGLFGLLGGYLTDRLGRRRVLTWSILIYAVSALAAGYSTSIEMLVLFRCTTFVGICVEFVAAVAWLAELFDNPRQREAVLGYTQAFSSVGGLLVTVVFLMIGRLTDAGALRGLAMPEWLGFLGEIQDGHAAWRYLLISGVIPALPLIIIRPFLPESPAWTARRDAGTLKRPSIAALFSPQYRRTTIVTALMFMCSYGAAFGAIQQLPQIVPGIPDVTEGAIEAKSAIGRVGLAQEFGGLFGRVALAFLAVRMVSRRGLLRVFQFPGLVIVPLVFALTPQQGFIAISIGAFLAGFFTVSQFSFWGNYLPRVYPLHLRGTGEGFAANIGGRMLGTGFAAVTSLISTRAFPEGTSAPAAVAMTAAGVALFVYLLGSALSFLLPEPASEELPE